MSDPTEWFYSRCGICSATIHGFSRDSLYAEVAKHDIWHEVLNSRCTNCDRRIGQAVTLTEHPEIIWVHFHNGQKECTP